MNIEFFSIALVGAAATTDLVSRRIPNVLVAVGLTTALMLHVFSPIPDSWQIWLFGALTGLALFLPFYLLRGMAAGDVKLMAAVGSFVGPLVALKIALATFLIGGLWALIVIVSKGKVRNTWINLRLIMLPVLLRAGGIRSAPAALPESVGRMPYGVAIALGTVTVLFLVPHW